jgi:hypothetical protein
VKIVAQRSIHGVLKNVRQFGSHLRKTREFVTRGCASKSVRRDVQTFEVFMARPNFLQHANILAQILQMLGSFLKE